MFKFIVSLILSFSFMVVNVSAKEADAVNKTIYGESYVVIDGDTNEVIVGKNPTERMYPASITKLITAILLAENKNPNDTLVFTQKAKEMPEYSINLNYYPMKVGEKLTADFVMKSILIFSANDMAQVAADNLSKELGVPFDQLMNNKLKEIGIYNTHFTNPVGLHDDNHYSTAYDLALLLKKAISYDWIREVIGIKSTTVSLPNGSLIIYENSNKLIDTDGIIGGKTGYTSKAGRTLVSAFEYNGKTYIGAVLKSIYDADDSYVFNDMLNIIEMAKQAKKVPFYKAGIKFSEDVNLTYKLFGFFGPVKTIQLPIYLKEDVYLYDNEFNKQNLKSELTLNSNINIFNSFNKSIGTLKFTVGDYEASYDVTADMSYIIKKNLHIYFLYTLVGIGIFVLAILLIKKIFRPRKKNNRIWA